MRVTGIRTKDFKDKLVKPCPMQLNELCETIVYKALRAGFLTEAHTLTGTSIKIGLHMCSFRIDVNKLGHNARLGKFIDSPKGYKRTNAPTWDQRVEFNDLVNDVFDNANLSARIMSGSFQVRNKCTGRRDEQDWISEALDMGLGVDGAQYNGMGEEVSRIVSEGEAREECDSDRLEREHKAKTRAVKNERAKEYRKQLKIFNKAKRVTVSGSYEHSGKKMTHTQFEKLLKKLYRPSKVLRATIETTAHAESLGF